MRGIFGSWQGATTPCGRHHTRRSNAAGSLKDPQMMCGYLRDRTLTVLSGLGYWPASPRVRIHSRRQLGAAPVRANLTVTVRVREAEGPSGSVAIYNR